MITFITAFKPFALQYKRIQKSALYSYWVNYINTIGIDTEGDLYLNCQKYNNVIVLRDILTAENIGFKNRSPLLNDMLKKSLEYVQTPYVGLINSDIIISENFNNLLTKILPTYDSNIFIAFTRYDYTLKKEIKTKKDLKWLFEEDSVLYDENSSSDLFISSVNNFKTIANQMPPFVLGRYAWDNWLHYFANAHFRCINGTKAIKTIHCRHDHSHIEKQEGSTGKKAPSSLHNINLLKDMQSQYGSNIRINTWETA